MKISNFSLDYVAREQAKPSVKADAGESALNEATVLYSQPVLRTLATAPEQTMRLHDLVDSVNRISPVSSFEEFQGVIGRLSSLGFIEILDKDLRGNHLVRLLKTA